WHGRVLKERQGEFGPDMRMVQRAVGRVQTELTRLADENVWTIDYLLSQPKGKNRALNGGMDVDDALRDMKSGEQEEEEEEEEDGDGMSDG
ncbi:U3 snoRNP protein, partial [Cryomyces antarcticus]